uniref:Reverse transcriptase domain-containing protein n=1 Tax=Angiostrongylus cantonensis TaxID=6313 RepID=A0A0K0DPB2_ANGCA
MGVKIDGRQIHHLRFADDIVLITDNMRVKIDGRQIHHLRFADDIVLITPNISQAQRMLSDFDKACGKIGVRLNFAKTIFMRKGLVLYVPFTLKGTIISECSNYVYLVREIDMMDDFAPELSKRKRAPWRAFKSIEDTVR